jgi:(1->4)-alpha-D-glucan 1-alpha-D-glucosylmutase
MEKALKEAKVHTSWVSPHEAYDQAVRSFVQRVLTPGAANRFLVDFGRFHTRIASAGMCNALAQTLLKITAPGVPDFYQGTELWDFSLVDPDNRRSVDFPTRIGLLEELQQPAAENPLALVQELLAHWQDGRVKLYVTYKALHYRKTHADLFLAGDYLPLAASGARREYVVAFARYHAPTWALVVVPRLVATLAARGKPPVGHRTWGRSALLLPAAGPGAWHNVLTGETLTASVTPRGKELPLGDIMYELPIALLSGTTTEPAVTVPSSSAYSP